MAIRHERLGFFNTRLSQRMNELGLTTVQVAIGTGLTYEQIRKLLLGHGLPSESSLEKLCGVLAMSRRNMKQRVARDEMIFKFGDAAWTHWGINPMAGPLYILFPLLAKDEQEIMRLHVIAFAEAKKRREKRRTQSAA
jgi:transcriptional regulator with XRE-family HTH domain